MNQPKRTEFKNPGKKPNTKKGFGLECARRPFYRTKIIAPIFMAGLIGCGVGETANETADAAAGLIAGLGVQQAIVGVTSLSPTSNANAPSGALLSSSESDALEWSEFDSATREWVSNEISQPWEASAASGSESESGAQPQRDSFNDYSGYFVAAVLYKDNNNNGGSLSMWVPNSGTSGNFSSFPSGWNDSVSSLRIKENCSIELYQHVNYGGYKDTYTCGSVACYSLTTLNNDQYSSAKINCADKVDAASLAFTGSNYTGTQLAMWGDNVSYAPTSPGLSNWTDPGSMAINGVDTPNSAENYIVEVKGPVMGTVYRVLDDATGNSLPSNVIDYVIRFIPRCSPKNSCFRGFACDGQSAGGVSSHTACGNISTFWRSYCNNKGFCRRVNNGDFVIPN